MKMLFTENWFIKAVSASPAKWRRAEKISLIILSSWCLFGSVRAGPQRTTSSSFFCWDRAAFFGQIEGREYSNSINAVKGSVGKLPKGVWLFVNSLCSFKVTLLFFGVTLLQDSTYIVQVPLPVFCARFPSNVGLPPRRESPTSRDRVWLQKVGTGTTPWSPAFCGKVRKISF